MGAPNCWLGRPLCSLEAAATQAALGMVGEVGTHGGCCCCKYSLGHKVQHLLGMMTLKVGDEHLHHDPAVDHAAAVHAEGLWPRQEGGVGAKLACM